MEKTNYELKELSINEKKSIQGGNPVFWFIAGAIAGGVVYDVVKKTWTTYVTEYIEFCEETGGKYVIHHAQ